MHKSSTAKLNLYKISQPPLSLPKVNSKPLVLFICVFTVFCSTTTAFAEEEKPDASVAIIPSPANKTTSITAVTPLVQQHKEDLKHYLTDEQITPLLVGDDEYLTLVKRYTSANSKGVVILLPEWQQGVTNPKAINYLRNILPSNGWSTIAIQPNKKPSNYPSTAITIAEQKTENKAVLDYYKEKLSTLFNAVMNTTKQYPGIVLVIAQGNNAALLIDLYSKAGNQRPNAFIMLSGYRQSNHTFINTVNENFARQLALTEIPVLDLYLKHDNPLVLAKAAQRKLLAKQEMKVYFRQRQLNNTVTGYYPEKELLSQINSWLKAIGW